MKHIEVEMLSETINCPVVSVPGRKFPGVVIQGDSLKILLDLVEDIEKSNDPGDAEELCETIISLKNKLSFYVAEYEKAMKTYGRELPYLKSLSIKGATSA